MKNFIKNRMISVFFSIYSITFLLCFRGSQKYFNKYPIANYINNPKVQFVIFLIIGFHIAWALFATDRNRKNMILKAFGVGFVLISFFKLYNLWKGTIVYNISSKVGLLGIFSGEIIFYLFMRLYFSIKENNQLQEKNIYFDSISKYRSQLMGIAMIYVMLFHTLSTKARYGEGLLDFFIRCGNSGVDIFIFLSGLGMVYSLSKNFNILQFYKKRILRIYPDYIPLVGLYSIVCWKKGLCSIFLVVLNCAGLSFWFSDHKCAFNWYIPAMIVFYLLAPFLFLILKKEDRRNFNFMVIYFASILLILVSYDIPQLRNYLIAFSRFPVFIFGMFAGFGILEKKRITKSEYYSIFYIFFITLLLHALKVKIDIPLRGWHWLPYCILTPVICLWASKIMNKCKTNSNILSFLKWAGENSLILYLVNVLSVRFTKMFMLKYIGGSVAVRNIYSYFVIIFDFIIVLMIVKIKENLKGRKLLWKRQ